MLRFLRSTLIVALLATAYAEDVEVTTVRFTNQRAPAVLGGTAGTGNWLEAEVSLNVRPPPGTPGQMVSRVRVALLMGFELPGVAGGERRLEHFRAEAECVALEAGRADVRFYLPPELVKRDQLHGDPKYWGVELAALGKPIPPVKTAYSNNLTTAEQRKNFQSKGGQQAAANDGILQPQYLTPFANQYARATPSFVRREGR
jgi:hypothetical protein